MSRPTSPSSPQADIPVVKPVVKPAVVSKAPPAGRKFPCSACGAKLDFDPSSQALKCPYCNHVERIAPAEHGIEERDYKAQLDKLANSRGAVPGRSSQVRCTACGAVVLLEDKVATEKCPFCATHLENSPEAVEDMIAPQAVLPFAVSNRDAQAAFGEWIASRWFAPSELLSFANLGQLSGVYLPFWTYDSMTYTHYTGQRGDDYQETETYTETEFYTETQTNADGTTSTVTNSRPVTKTRTVTKTNWYPVSGQVQHFFDDVLVEGTASLAHDEAVKLTPWDLHKLEEFKPDFLSGFKTERYAVGLEEGFTKARAIMDGEIRTLCCQDIGGNHQQLSSVQTQHVGVTFKHILLPVWLGAYRYRDTPYRVLVNARTGKVFGRRPYSAMKIVMLIVVIVALILLLLGLAGLLGALGGNRRQFGAGPGNGPCFALVQRARAAHAVSGVPNDAVYFALVQRARAAHAVSGVPNDPAYFVRGSWCNARAAHAVSGVPNDPAYCVRGSLTAAHAVSGLDTETS